MQFPLLYQKHEQNHLNKYNQFFYLPPYPKQNFSGGIARLDRLRVILSGDRRVCNPTQIALSDEAISVLIAMIRELFGSTVEEELQALRELLKETLPPEIK